VGRVGRFWALLGLCVLLVVSCGRSLPENAPSTGRDPQRIVLGTTGRIDTLDPADAYGTFVGSVLYNLGDRLYTYELGTTTLKPQLATALPTVSPDGLTYTIPLRKGVVFHDGEPFNAQAMAFSLNRFIQNGGAPSFLLSDPVKSVTATGESELTIQLNRPFAAFPALLAFSGLCAISPKAYEIKSGSFQPEKFVGTGPYKLVKFGTDQMRLDTFDRYWDKAPANRGIDIQFFSSPSNLFNAFRTGAVDLAYQGMAVEQITVLQQEAATQGWRGIEQAGSGINLLTLNLKSPPLDKLEVRQAIAALIDRPLLQERVFQGQVEPLYSLIPSNLPEQKPVFQQYGDRNLAKAAALLTQVGYSPSHPLKLELWYRSNVGNDQLAAITLKAVADKFLGGQLQITLNSVESTTAYKNLDKGVYPLFLLDWTPDFLDPDNYISPFLNCTKGAVQTGCEQGDSQLWGSFYYSDRARTLIARSRQETNPQQRKQLFTDLQELLAQDVPFIPLWQTKDYLFAQKWMQNPSLEVTQKLPFWNLTKS